MTGKGGSAVVIIPSYGDPACLFRALLSLSVQKTLQASAWASDTISKVDVLVVHSGPLPMPPRQRWPRLPHHWRIECVSPVCMSAALARNLAVELTNAELLVFMDADCIAGPYFLASHLEAHRKGCQLVSGAVLPCDKESSIGKAEYLLEFATTRLRRPGGAVSAPGCNLSMCRSLFESVGGFPELEAGEYVLMNLRLRQKGYRIKLHPHAVVFHSGRQSLSQYRKHRLFIGTGLGQLTAHAEREGLLDARLSPEYHMLRWICRSPYGCLLIVAKLFRLLALMLQGDTLVLQLLPARLWLVLEGLWLEARACRQAYQHARGNDG